MNISIFNVGDAVKVFAPTPNSPFYLVGRVIYIDEINSQYEYGVIHYGRDSNILVIHVTADRTEASPVPNPPSCPSHGFTMDYVDEIVEREKSGYITINGYDFIKERGMIQKPGS